MSALDMALRMWPMWALGFMMILIAVTTGNKDLLKVDRKSVFSWVKILAIISAMRAVIFYFSWDYSKEMFKAVSWLPLETTTMVWWEDAAHTLPLLLLFRLIGTSKRVWPIHALAFTLVWASFLMGHVYQGWFAAILISAYIPYTLNLSKEKGLGTIMICHVLYDLATIGLMQFMLRVM